MDTPDGDRAEVTAGSTNHPDTADSGGGADSSDPTDSAEEPASTLPSEGRYTQVSVSLTDSTCGALFTEVPNAVPSSGRVTLLDSSHFRLKMEVLVSEWEPQTDCAADAAGALTCADASWTGGDTNRMHAQIAARTVALDVVADTRFTHDQELTVNCGGPMTDGYNGCSDWDDALGLSWPCSVRMSVQYDME